MKRPSKYRNRRTVVDGITFASAKEARRYAELKLLESAGEIAALQLQRRFPLVVNDVKICTYVSDFSYTNRARSGPIELIVEDTKGFCTREYIFKRRLMLACHGIAIRET